MSEQAEQVPLAADEFVHTNNTGQAFTLFVLTLILELISIYPRYWVGRAIIFPLYALGHILAIFSVIPDIERQAERLFSLHAFLVNAAWIIAWAPLVVAVLSLLILPTGGNLLTRFALGARHPSERERMAVTDSLRQLNMYARVGTKAPSHWYVVDEVAPRAFTIGSTLYLTRELIKSPYLTPLLASEYSRLNSWDGLLTLALRRFVLPPIYFLTKLGNPLQVVKVVKDVTPKGDPAAGGGLSCMAVIGWIVLFLAGGGLGVRILNPLWARFWRQRVFAADYFAARLGQASGMIEYLERYEFFDVAVPFFNSQQPPVELRIDRLNDLAQTLPPPTITTGDQTAHLRVRRRRILSLVLRLGVLIALVATSSFYLLGGLRVPVEGQWRLEGLANIQGVEPMPKSEGYRFNMYLLNGEVVLQYIDETRNVGAQARGVYRYDEDDTIFIDIQGDYAGVLVPMDGPWEVSRSGDQLILRGIYGSRAFRLVGPPDLP
jgi:hypothetical protein